MGTDEPAVLLLNGSHGRALERLVVKGTACCWSVECSCHVRLAWWGWNRAKWSKDVTFYTVGKVVRLAGNNATYIGVHTLYWWLDCEQIVLLHYLHKILHIAYLQDIHWWTAGFWGETQSRFRPLRVFITGVPLCQPWVPPTPEHNIFI